MPSRSGRENIGLFGLVASSILASSCGGLDEPSGDLCPQVGCGDYGFHLTFSPEDESALVGTFAFDVEVDGKSFSLDCTVEVDGCRASGGRSLPEGQLIVDAEVFSVSSEPRIDLRLTWVSSSDDEKAVWGGPAKAHVRISRDAMVLVERDFNPTYSRLYENVCLACEVAEEDVALESPSSK